MRSDAVKSITIPSAGVVKGGRLHGWRFHFVCFVVDGGALTILARWTPPAWPFFREFAANHDHFSTLRPVVGERAKRMPAAPLIASAYRVTGVNLPADHWLLASEMTLRARIKRTHPVSKRTTS